MYGSEELIEKLQELGFTPADNDPRILEIEFTGDTGFTIAEALGYTDYDFDQLVLQYDQDSETMSCSIDGDLDLVEPEEVIEALEGEE